MNGYNSIEELIDAPDTVDFVLRGSEFLDNFLKETPELLVTQVLGGRYYVSYAKRNDLPKIIEGLGTSFASSATVVLGTLDRESLEASGIIQVQQQPNLNLKGKGVLIGIVDTGIDYTLDTFRYEDGTSKIKYIFDQLPRAFKGKTPEGFFVGTEYTNEQINEALKSENPYDIVPQRDESGHGTFLASLAAGREVGDFIGAAPEAELIVVKLKKARPYYLERFSVPEDQQNVFESSAVMVGVEYVLRKALELGRPVVICLGVGTNFGGHDGFSVLEEYLSNVSNLRGVCLCVAAGNESQARHHMRGQISASGEQQNIDLKVGSGQGDVYLTIWNGVSDRTSVSVRSPTGELVARIPAKSGIVNETKLILEPTTVRIEYYFPVEGSSGQVTVIKLLGAAPGIWTITVYGDIILEGTFNSWLPITGFIAPDTQFLASTPYQTVTIPATMIGSISCGAYDSRTNSLYSDSSWGPTRISAMVPDLVAPGVNIGGFYPTGYGAMSGTSTATAITAGGCALIMQWGVVDGNDPSLSTFQIRAYLIRGCTRSESMQYPNPQWGYGQLNLLQTFQLMREQ